VERKDINKLTAEMIESSTNRQRMPWYQFLMERRSHQSGKAYAPLVMHSQLFALTSLDIKTLLSTVHVVVCEDVYLEEERPHTEILGVAQKGATLTTIAKGNLRVGKLYLKDVLKCPSLVANLISEASLESGLGWLRDSNSMGTEKGDKRGRDDPLGRTERRSVCMDSRAKFFTG
jgi:hypothetical protein